MFFRLSYFLLSTLYFTLSLQAQQSIAFSTASYNDFIQQAKTGNKPVMIYFTGTGCSLCKKMEREVFNQPEIFSYYNQSFINVESFDDFKNPDQATKALRLKYEIISNPTFIFIDTNGMVMHKGGYKTVDDFSKMGKQALSRDNYRNWKGKIETGNFDTEVLNKYLSVEQNAALYAESGYQCAAQSALNKYFSSIPLSAWQLSENWEIIDRFVANPYSEVFNYLLENCLLFEKKYGTQSVNRKIYMVYKNAWSGNTGSAAYKKAEALVLNSNHPMAKTLIGFRKMSREYEQIIAQQTEWNSFLIKYDTLVMRYSYITEPYWIYSITDDINNRKNLNKQALETSNKWMQAILKYPENEDEYYLATYAKSCFLSGKLPEAIKHQEKAIELAESRNIDAEDIELMIRDLKTYKK